ncbi:D-aspartate oxidase-like [Tigriopus californicus]|uniref:D-aspartate oxidase-like n=1 Tax=Tigriopus californicus TaxID=6832 RepID=UPI0027DA9D48|nr:D-aspartate oxidase-like [Tigriopus californicus]
MLFQLCLAKVLDQIYSWVAASNMALNGMKFRSMTFWSTPLDTPLLDDEGWLCYSLKSFLHKNAKNQGDGLHFSLKFLYFTWLIGLPYFVSISSSSQYGLVVNCTGLGARKLCRDALVLPKPSKIVQVVAPWMKTAVKVESQISILPGLHQLTLHSGTQHSKLPPNVWAQACQVMPRLKDAAHQIHDTFVWRSHRIHPRLEFEQIGPLNVIHNYGHGDSSVVLAPGFADAVINMSCKVCRKPQNTMGKL